MAEKKLLQPAPLAPLVDGTAHDPTTQECLVTANNSVLAPQASEDSAAKALMDKYGNAATAATPQTVDCLWNNGGGPVVDDWYEHLGECEREPVKAQVETALPWRKDMDRGNPCLNGNVGVLMAHSSPEFRPYSDVPVYWAAGAVTSDARSRTRESVSVRAVWRADA
jgi:hypothetical protein